MFKFIISFLFFAIIHGIECPDDQYSYKGECIALTCQPFIEKLISTKKPSGSRFIPISFNGKIVKKGEYYIELTFDDDQEGTFHRDNNKSCIIDELYLHQLNYLDGAKSITNITSSYLKNERKWSFSIGNISALYIDYQKDKSIYNGYYSMRFIVGTHLQLLYMFDFQLIFNLKDSLIETHFHSQILDDKEACTIFSICSQFLQSEIYFCKNETCSEFIEETPKLFLNQSLFFVQKLEADFSNWYLHDIEITFQGDKMVKKFRPFYEKPEEGSTQARIITPFISGPGTFYFAAKVSQTNFWGRRALQQQVDSPICLAKVEIACIAKSNHSECPNEAEIQDYNELDCGDVDLMYCESGNILLVGLLIWLI